MNNKKSLGYGILIISSLCFLYGFFSIRIKGLNPYGAGFVFLGLLFGIQFLKAMGRTPKRIIKLFSWAVVLGFIVVDAVLVYITWIKK